MTTSAGTPSAAAAAAPLALVAGGSRGLGLLIARELGARGYRLVLTARDLTELEEAAEELTRAGRTVSVRACDVADADAVTRLVADVEATEGPIEVLFTVAGVIQVGPLEALERHHFSEAIDIMLWGPINTALAVVGPMKSRRRGRIGIVTSIGGLVSVPHLLPYSTAKFGAVGFSSGLRHELVGTGVTVTTIAPGLMRTGSHLQAEFVGQHGKEYAWFSASASMPVISMNAERAAAAMVTAVLAGRSVLVLTWVAKLAMRMNGLAPRTTAALLGIATRLLPSGGGGTEGPTLRGWDARKKLRGPVATAMKQVTTLGRRAAARYNQRP